MCSPGGPTTRRAHCPQQNERCDTFLQATEVSSLLAPLPLPMVQLSQDNSKMPLADQRVNWERGEVTLEKGSL